MPENILARILKTKRKEVAELRCSFDLSQLKAVAEQAPRPRNFFAAVTAKGRRMLNLIAEVKKASPSAGVIRPDFDPVAIARCYAQGGANAISVLTDEKYFQGSLDYLRAVRNEVDIPVLRKDFVIDPYQVYESRAAGADAILLIAAAMPVGTLRDLMLLAAELGMTSLVEVHNADELLAVLPAISLPDGSDSLLGINNRDLTTFKTDISTTVGLSELAGDGVSVVSESGIKTRRDVERLQAAGVCGILVGETLMRSDDMGLAIEQLLGPAN